MGGLLKRDQLLLIGPGRNEFLRGMDEINRKADRAKTGARRIEVFFYYSGHSNEEAILLGGEKVYYKEISNSIKTMPADVRIAILD